MKRLTCVIVALVMIINILPTQAGAEKFSFDDVNKEAWYYDYACYVSDKGIMTGVGDNKFLPDSSITVAEVITIASRIHADSHGDVIADIGAEKWYKKYTEYADKNKIATKLRFGYSYESEATRAEVASVFASLICDDEVCNSGVTYVPDMRDKARLAEFVDGTDYQSVLNLMRAGVVKGKD